MGTGLLHLLGVVGLWSITPILVKIVLRELDPFSLAFLRLFQATAVLLLLYRIRGGRWGDLLPPSRWLFIGGLGIGINYILFTLSLNFTTASAGILIVQIQVVTLVVLAALFLGERLTAPKIGGMVTVICGVFLIVWGPSTLGNLFNPEYALGNAIMLLAGIAWGVYGLANKALAGHLGSFNILIPIFGIGALATGPLAATQFEVRAPFSLSTLAAIFTLGCLCTGGSFYLLSEGMKRLSAALAGTMTTMSPLLSVLLARVTLHEDIPGTLFVAAGLIGGGILLIAYAERNGNRLPSTKLG